MGIAKSCRELNVYQLSRNAAYSIYMMTKAFPPHEKYSLTDQIRRSSRAVNAMVAAAWARRRYRAAFISKLGEAQEEAAETQAWLDHAVDCSYITDEQFRVADAQWQSTGAMISAMINKADDFCKFPSDKSYAMR
jgi:four helix bundle protein